MIPMEKLNPNFFMLFCSASGLYIFRNFGAVDESINSFMIEVPEQINGLVSTQ